MHTTLSWAVTPRDLARRMGFGLVAILVIGAAPCHKVPALADWSEPNQPAGCFAHWQSRADEIEGHTEKVEGYDPKGSAWLRSNRVYEGDVEVHVRCRFQAGHYLACYLCFDPQTQNGYWLSTGHTPDAAYIKKVDQGRWKVVKEGDLPSPSDGHFDLIFRRHGAELALLSAGQPILTYVDNTYHRGRVQIRLHNTDAVLESIEVHGTPAE